MQHMCVCKFLQNCKHVINFIDDAAFELH